MKAVYGQLVFGRVVVNNGGGERCVWVEDMEVRQAPKLRKSCNQLEEHALDRRLIFWRDT